MSRNASGVYSKPAGTTAIAFTTIESAKYNLLMDDFAAEITASLPRAGTAAMTGDLPFGTNRAKDLGAATALTDAPQAQQVLNNSLSAAIDSGVADAYVLTLSPPPTVYTQFMEVWFTTSNTNTGASTININGIGLKNIQTSSGVSVTAGEISTTKPNHIIYDGIRFILVGVSGSSFPLCAPGEGTAAEPAVWIDCENIWLSTNGVGFFGRDRSGQSYLAATVRGNEIWRINEFDQIVFTGDGNEWVRDVDNDSLFISGGSTINSGGVIGLWGPSSSEPGNVGIYSDNDLRVEWDETVGALDLKGNPIINTPSLAKSFCRVTASGGTVVLSESFNVTSVTDRGVGQYTINFTTAHTNANYIFSAATEHRNSADSASINFIGQEEGVSKTASALPIIARTTANVNTDVDEFYIITFGT